MNISRDKSVEKARYDHRAARVLKSGQISSLGPIGSLGVPLALRAPYARYESCIRRHVHTGTRVLDVCCGNGQHSFTAAQSGAEVTVSDIAPSNVQLAIVRGLQLGFRVTGIVADAESLPLPDYSFDMVTCAGSLSYVDGRRFLREVCRVLRPGGIFACVDSLNHNPIYRTNRWIHQLFRRRSRSVICRTPTAKTIRELQTQFPLAGEVFYHGLLSFLVPALVRCVGDSRAAAVLDEVDLRFQGIGRYGFKFVFCGGKSVN